jgi:hypothetical protein
MSDDNLEISDYALSITPVGNGPKPFARMRLFQPNNRPGIYCRRALLVFSGAYLVTAGVCYIALGSDFSFPMYLGNASPGTTQNILLHASDNVPVLVSEFTLQQGILAGGGISLHTVEF